MVKAMESRLSIWETKAKGTVHNVEGVVESLTIMMIIGHNTRTQYNIRWRVEPLVG